MKNANEILFRCSGLSYIMKNDRSGKKMGETAKTHLIDVFVSAMYGRREEANGKALEKGNAREEDSITLLSLSKKMFFKKNEEHLANSFIKGTPDLYLGESVKNAEETIDTKTSWSANTFFRSKHKELDEAYYWQGQGYMALTGAKKHTVAFCLVNGLPKAIMDEKRKASYFIDAVDLETSEEYKEKCRQIEVNHIFDIKSFREENPWFEFHNNVDEWTWDIPREERIHTVEIQKNEEDIKYLYRRVNECRDYMNENLFTKQLKTA